MDTNLVFDIQTNYIICSFVFAFLVVLVLSD